jgi:MFS family permease
VNEAPPDPMEGRKWPGLAVLFLGQMLAIGAASFGYGLFVEPLSTDYGLTRAEANSGLILLLVGMALWSPLIGRALDVVPSRHVLIGAGLAFASGLLVVAWSHSLTVSAIATVALIASGTAALGPLSGSTLAARWFTARRGRALGIVAVSSSMGGFLVVPTLGWLITVIGWRGALTVLAAFIIIVFGGLVLLVIRDPTTPSRSRGAAQPGRNEVVVESYSARQLLATRDLWLLVFVVGTMMAISQVILSVLIPYALDQGVALGRASLLISAAAASSIVGKIVIGSLADRIDLRWLQLFVIAVMAAFLVILALHPPYPILLASCLLAGMSIGGTTPLWAAFVSMLFGARSVGQGMGLMMFLQLPLVFGALRFSGSVFDRTGRYDFAFIVFLALLPLVVLALLPLVPRGKLSSAEGGSRITDKADEIALPLRSSLGVDRL